jgi:Cu(I)/Ag(I) efflux system membrane fusion protein
MAAISRGLAAGESIVVSGQFMLDSEANLRGELERISSPPAEPGDAGRPDHKH